MDPDPDPALDPDPSIIMQMHSKKNLDSYYFVTLLSLKNDVNVASKSNKQKKRN
jgi:hypothetical protein